MTERKFFKDRTSRIFGVNRLPKIERPTLFAGIQAASGAFSAYYLREDPTYQNLSYICSTVAVIGTYNLLKMRKNASREAKNKPMSAIKETPRNYGRRIKNRSTWSLVNGTFTYVTNIYIFSELFKSNDKMWISSIATAASGYYFAISFIDNMKTNFTKNAFWNFCQLIFEPALITSTALYLMFFRNHREDFLYWLPFVFITTTGFKIANRGFGRVENELQPKLLLLRAIEMLTGGCLLTIGGTVLTIYTSLNDFHMLCITLSAIASFFGVFVTFGSITCFRRYVDLDREVFFSIVGMITGPIMFLSSCVMVICVKDAYMVYFPCFFFAGFGHMLVFRSVLKLYMLVPAPVVYKYCQRVLGPVLIIYSSSATACIGYRMGWRFSLALMPFIPAGIYATYAGFRKKHELE